MDTKLSNPRIAGLMRRTSITCKAAALAVTITAGLSAFASQANAALIDVITNGEFEIAPAFAGFIVTPNASVPGWSGSNGMIELWQQGGLGSPALGTDGLGTGNHLEVNVNGPETTTQIAALPGSGLMAAMLDFDAWLRGATTGTVRLTGSVSGIILADLAIAQNQSTWTANNHAFNVMGGETLTLAFSSLGTGGVSI
nr:hypothetical protein [Alphaproteobacteria bacterium]